jgi:hypothetical protein
MDKPVDEASAIEYFWKMLRENSQNTRGCVQRIAYVDQNRAKEGRDELDYLQAGAFNQLLCRIARSRVEDQPFCRILMQADVTIVNHVFNAKWALQNTGGYKILETHDIQSIAMAGWPLLNDASGRMDDVKTMLASEFEMLKQFDHVVNVAAEEHRVLIMANPAASLITPYIPRRQPTSRFKTIAQMASHLGWDQSYQSVQRFDMLVTGDSHPANVESVIWFIENVFKPFLSPQGFSLAVVGRVSNAIYARGLRVPYLFYVGFVEDLGKTSPGLVSLVWFRQQQRFGSRKSPRAKPPQVWLRRQERGLRKQNLGRFSPATGATWARRGETHDYASDHRCYE